MDEVIGRGRAPEKRLFDAPLADLRARTFTLYDVTVATLDERFKQRHDEFVSSRNRAVLSVVLISLAGMAIAFWIGESTAARIRRLTSVVRDVAASGRTGAPLDATAPDEIGALAGAVNELVAGRSPLGWPQGEPASDENLRLKVLIADLALENQQLRASGGGSITLRGGGAADLSWGQRGQESAE